MQSNKVVLLGYVGQHIDPTIAANGSKRVSLRVATHYKHKNQTGELITHTVWHNVVAWNGTADYAECSFVKGSKILIEGAIVYKTYIDSSGISRTCTFIRAQYLTNLDR